MSDVRSPSAKRDSHYNKCFRYGNYYFFIYFNLSFNCFIVRTYQVIDLSTYLMGYQFIKLISFLNVYVRVFVFGGGGNVHKTYEGEWVF